MTRPPRLSGRELVGVLRRGGYQVTHVRGSHYYLRKSGAAGLVVVPVHGSRDVPTGTFRAVLRQADLTVEEFFELMRGS